MLLEQPLRAPLESRALPYHLLSHHLLHYSHLVMPLLLVHLHLLVPLVHLHLPLVPLHHHLLLPPQLLEKEKEERKLTNRNQERTSVVLIRNNYKLIKI
jgi:hypothetical protein